MSNKKSVETRGVRISKDSYEKMLEIKKLLIEMGIRKNIHFYEIIDEALDMYLWHIKKLWNLQRRED